ncbi:MAG: MBG domain-containing protein, partial [Alphaproteobacteria bacterium]
AAPLTITGGTTTATYTAAAQTNSFTTSGLLGSDSVTGVSGRATGTNVGTYNDALSAATGTGLGNYNISYVNRALTITPRQITVRANDLARDYNTANPSLTYGITSGSLANGDSFTGSLATDAGLLSQAGSYAITQGSLALSANYAMSFLPGTLTVKPTAIMAPGGSASSVVASMDETLIAGAGGSIINDLFANPNVLTIRDSIIGEQPNLPIFVQSIGGPSPAQFEFQGGVNNSLVPDRSP